VHVPVSGNQGYIDSSGDSLTSLINFRFHEERNVDITSDVWERQNRHFVALKASRRRLDELGQLALTTAIISFVINTYVRKKFTMLPS
jgi:hypothetical protein